MQGKHRSGRWWKVTTTRRNISTAENNTATRTIDAFYKLHKIRSSCERSTHLEQPEKRKYIPPNENACRKTTYCNQFPVIVFKRMYLSLLAIVHPTMRYFHTHQSVPFTSFVGRE